nr:MAG TPA: hypothetical protein [Caudoviricetes sp.]
MIRKQPEDLSRFAKMEDFRDYLNQSYFDTQPVVILKCDLEALINKAYPITPEPVEVVEEEVEEKPKKQTKRDKVKKDAEC